MSEFTPAGAGCVDLDSADIQARADEHRANNMKLSLPPGQSDGGEHVSSPLSPDGIKVRGRDYLKDKVKVDAESALFDLMHVDMWRSPNKVGNVAARKDSWLRSARAVGDTRMYFIVTYVTPATPFVHLSIYFAVQPGRLAARPHAEKMWNAFCGMGPAGDTFRNERWKVIPRIAEGPWAVQAAVGTKPALLGSKLEHTWVLCPGNDATVTAAPLVPAPQGNPSSSRPRGSSFLTTHGPGPYIEADCDVSSSSMAYVLVSLIQGSCQ